MKENYFKFISSTFIVGVFLLFSCGKSGTREITKDYFCGKVFSTSSTIKSIDVKTNQVTIFNCDGTYTSTSKVDWGTSPETQKAWGGTYEKGNTNFSGTWEVIDNKKLPEEIDRWLEKYSGKTDFYKEKPFTVLKYKSNASVSGYLLITGYELKGNISLSHIITSNNMDWEEDEYNLYDGFLVK